MGCCGGKRPEAPTDGCPYKVGKRYKVARPLEVWSSESLDGTRLASLRAKKDVVLLVQVSDHSGAHRGYVIPQPAENHPAGWISLEDLRGKSMQSALQRAELPGSWDLKARYSVQNPATLRAGPTLDSDWIGELNAGAEVLLLDFSVTVGDGKARLRALVSAGDKIGWMSPETGVGDHLLEPVNLLSRKVVDLHKQSMRQSSSGGGGVRKSYQQGGNSPWEAGATYRMLERVAVRSTSDLASSELFKVSAGGLVEVQETNNVELQGGWCPVARIIVEEGTEKGKTGWVRCSAKDGHDLMDTRDHKEYEKILEKMRRSIDAELVHVSHDATPAAIQAGIVETQKKLEAKKEEERRRQEELEQQEKEKERQREEQKEKERRKKELTEDTDGPVQQEKPTAPSEKEALRPGLGLADAMHDLEHLDTSGQDDRRPIGDRMEPEEKLECCMCSCGR
ncbi:unnamed protein product [Effrenium voratum]|uniref:Uncharacterized protein n=1 Tax=Effrenium voratum TaxID=2562239 RepID=A0AA36I0Y5_9DINO|nr:unnamed protein product [Effrenium voratum]CAJ1441605.1 unnamed protein product [Effrenium voratum]